MAAPAERLVVVGGSSGGVDALRVLLGALRPDFGWPIIVVLHVADSDISGLVSLLGSSSVRRVVEAQHGQPLSAAVHLAPGNYHLLVEPDWTLALSVDARVAHARPSIDVLFASAADSVGARAIGVILSGANDDGARGLAQIVKAGGLALVQDPAEAEVAIMPAAAQKLGGTVALPLQALAARLNAEYGAPWQTQKN